MWFVFNFGHFGCGKKDKLIITFKSAFGNNKIYLLQQRSKCIWFIECKFLVRPFSRLLVGNASLHRGTDLSQVTSTPADADHHWYHHLQCLFHLRQRKHRAAARRQQLLMQFGVNQASPGQLTLGWEAKEEFLNSARRGHKDDGGEGPLGKTGSPRRGSIFSQRFSWTSVCPEFHFHFYSESEIRYCTFLILPSMQQHVIRAWAPKHVMRVEIY